MLRALKESLKREVIVAAYRKTRIYPWDPKLLLDRAVAVYPSEDSVKSHHPDPVSSMMSAVIASTPRDKTAKVTKHKNFQRARARAFTLDDTWTSLKNITKSATLKRRKKAEARQKERGKSQEEVKGRTGQKSKRNGPPSEKRQKMAEEQKNL